MSVEIPTDLGDAAAERGRRQLEHAGALERLRQTADLVHQPAGRERRVIRERFVADVDELEHPEGRRRASDDRAGVG
jgi:hypothetical protein